MKTLTNLTASEISLIIKGIVLGYEYNDTIDEQYDLKWEVTEATAFFQVKYDWFKGSITEKEKDPRLKRDSTLIPEGNYFLIMRSHDMEKLTREVMDAISEVTAHSFDPYFEEAF